ncbi:MAG: FecR domain-containing protein [Myxococcota bacterium]
MDWRSRRSPSAWECRRRRRNEGSRKEKSSSALGLRRTNHEGAPMTLEARKSHDKTEHLIPPELPPTDLLYADLERRTHKRRSRRRVARTGVVLAAVGVALVVAWPASEQHPAWAGTLLETREDPARVTMVDGSIVEARPVSSLELLTAREDEVRVALRAGSARFSVVPNESRSFVVEVGSTIVEVVGTRFEVSRSAGVRSERVRVRVSEGVVRVHRGTEERLLRAGEEWTASESVVLAADEQAQLLETPAATAIEMPAEPDRVLHDAEHPDDPVVRDPIEVVREVETPAALFDRARAARRDGEPRQAAELYARLVQRFPRDGRVGLAAFELARLRMDVLGDRAGAVEALRASLRSSGGAMFREEAMVRLIRAYDRPASKQLCEQARDAYLSAYPSGAYAGEAHRRCQPTP